MGPERFWGLPGLILQIKFTNFVGEYTATHIHFQKVDIAIPNTGVKVTKEQILERNKIDKKWLKKASDLLNNDN
jgi:GLPGLI family protein